MALFAGAIFLSSFLLFLLQPIFAKLILPWFGGSAAVWTMCLVFFQSALLAGYCYSHGISSKLSPRAQSWVHIGLLAIAISFLPVLPGMRWKPTGSGNPTWQILGLLTAVLGLPYVLLSSTSPLLQKWYVQRWPDSDPYRLFALSNVAALIGLSSYPILIEPHFSTHTQDLAWSIGFAAFALTAAASALYGRVKPASIRTDEEDRPSLRQRAEWIALAAAGSMLLLSVTNQLTQNVAPVPLLCILPLVLYLLTFILCFESGRWYRPSIFLRLLAVALASVGYAIYDVEESTSLVIALPVFAAGLFFGCMYCHGELSRRRPHGALTSFYLMIALGGALGSIFVGLIAPVLFSAIYELPAALLLTAMIAAYFNWSAGWAQRLLWIAVTTAMALVLISEVRGYRKQAVVMMRSFYSGLRVVQSVQSGAEVRTLYHGTIEHGAEFLSPARRLAATSYYGPASGAGLTLRLAKNGPKHVGIIGLGVGTLSSYGQAGDDFEFYEINSQVAELANAEFFFLRDTPARTRVTIGDARLSLEREAAQAFDILLVDAFSGDAIPVHLLTKEAFALYFRHLNPTGILAIHVSNQYLDLAPVVQTLASEFGYPAVLIHSAKNESQLISAATWVLVTQNREFLSRPEIQNASEPIPPHPSLRPWTDDYNNLLQVIRWTPGS